MPSFAFVISKILGLPPSLSAGLILLGCCPGGTASNVVCLPFFPHIVPFILSLMCKPICRDFIDILFGEDMLDLFNEF